jgi:hypothetical protein
VTNIYTLLVFLTSVVGVELDDGILFQCQHQQRRKQRRKMVHQVTIFTTEAQSTQRNTEKATSAASDVYPRMHSP